MNDALLTFCTDLAVTASAAGTDKIPLSEARRIGNGRPVYGTVVCTEAMTDAGSDSTVTPKLQADNDEAFGSATDCDDFKVFPALSAVGTKRQITLDPTLVDEAYLRIYFTVANGNLTTGKFSAWISDSMDDWKGYPSGFSIIKP